MQQPSKVNASASNIKVAWLKPNTGGSNILGYKVYINGATQANLATNGSTLTLDILNSMFSLVAG
jgi:hypothetical protein